MPVVDPKHDEELTEVIKIIGHYFCDAAEEAARSLYLDKGFSKTQSCSLVLSGVGCAMVKTLDQLAKTLDLTLSEDKKNEIEAGINTLLNKLVKELYDTKDGKLN